MKTLLIRVLLFVFVTTLSFEGAAQYKRKKFIRKLKRNTWTIGASGTVIDDDSKALKDLFAVPDSWDFLYFPSKFNFEGELAYGFSAEASLTYTQLKKGKLLGEDNYARPYNVNLVAFDLNSKFDLNEAIGLSRFFAPYTIFGFGYTYRSYPERKTAYTGNFGLGFNIWLAKGIGINAQSMAKFALNNAYGKNYLQHSIGLVYRFSFVKGYKKIDRIKARYSLFKH